MAVKLAGTAPAAIGKEGEIKLTSGSDRLGAANFGERALAAMSTISFSAGQECLFWNTGGRTMATGMLAFPGFAEAETQEDAGSAALALALIAKELDGGNRSAAMTARLVDLGGGSLGILVEGNPRIVVRALASFPALASRPAFLEANYPEAEWQDALKILRISALGADASGGPGKGWRLGTAQGLFAADLARARDAWRSAYTKDRTRSILIADRAALADSPDFAAALPTENPFPARERPRLEDQGAQVVLAEYLALKSGNAGELPWNLGPRGAAISESFLRLIPSAFRSTGPANPGKVLAAATMPRFAAAKTQALYELFGDGRGERAAIAMGLDLAAGGDGSLPFILGDAIEATDAAALTIAAGNLGIAFP
ncbi:MAG TPA: hypothetical protein VMV83_08260 [Rectinemataceae bacterium]|nr:hypothetical protein [Rectinemataceae bacterium]